MVERPVWSAKWVGTWMTVCVMACYRPDLTWLKGPGDVISNPDFLRFPATRWPYDIIGCDIIKLIGWVLHPFLKLDNLFYHFSWV